MTTISNLDYFFQGLRLKPSLQYQLLDECLGQMTGAEVAVFILRELGRTDVKVCCTKDQGNCYSPMLNFLGLSPDVANSSSIIAVAIAAHEVGHALQYRFLENLRRFSKVANIFDHFSLFGELFIMATKICISLPDFTFFDKTITKSNHYRLFNKTVLLKCVVFLLFLPINLIIIFLFAIKNIFLLIVSLSCVFIRRLLIFISEIQASVIALRLLKEYKILDRNQQNIARKFLFSCALTYLRSSSIYTLF